MSTDLDLIARLMAFESGEAVSIASHGQVSIQGNALIICPIAMAGEDTTVHVVAVGQIGGPAEVRSIPDPRFRDDQYTLFEWLGERIERLFNQCRERGTFPQLWVSSSPAVAHLDTLGDRLRFNNENPRVKRFGELLSYATERFPVAGQQALLSATAALRMHFATGQQDGEDEHLGTFLTWLRPPRDCSIQAAVALAELQPMGVKTDPIFDRDVLAPIVGKYNDARRAKASGAILAKRAEAIHAELEKVVRPIYNATQQAIRVLQDKSLPPMPDLAAMEERESGEFASFMASRDRGFFLPVRDSAKLAAFRLSDREHALQNAESAIVQGDNIGRARARLAGRVLTGIVEWPRRIRVAPRVFEISFDIISVQRILRVRRRDELVLLGARRGTALVTDVRRTGRTTRVSVTLTEGKRTFGVPTTGQQVEFGPQRPDWQHIVRMRGQLSTRLTPAPWTHNTDSTPQPSPKRQQQPPDLLKALEGLQ